MIGTGGLRDGDGGCLQTRCGDGGRGDGGLDGNVTAMAGLIAEVTSMQRRWRARQECDGDGGRDSGSDVDAKAMVVIAVDLFVLTNPNLLV